MGLKNLLSRVDDDADRGQQQQGRDDGRGNGFRFAVTVGMIVDLRLAIVVGSDTPETLYSIWTPPVISIP